MPERFLGDWPRDAILPFSQGKSRFIPTHFDRDSSMSRRCPGLSWETVRVYRSTTEIGLHEQFLDFSKLKG